MATPTLIVVTGPAQSGSPGLAHALAAAIPCPVICRDEIKEGLAHAEGGRVEAAAGDPLTRRTLPLFFDVLRTLLVGGVTVVAEAAFQDPLWRPGLEPLTELAELRIVHCTVDPAVARARRDAAVEGGGRRAYAQIIGDELADWERAYASFQRLSLPAPSIEVDTSDGYVPDLARIVEFATAR